MSAKWNPKGFRYTLIRFMRSHIEKILAKLAKKVITRYKPRIVAVTGSVGKTSAKNAIVAILSGRMSVRTGRGNYNTEFGVPLTIIDAKAPNNSRSITGWLVAIVKGVRLAYGTKVKYPEVLVLEFGTEFPGDLAKLCEIAPPEVGVVTRISPVHVENFDNLEKLVDEKTELVRRVKTGGLAILNRDDDFVYEMKRQAGGEVKTFGFESGADVQGSAFSLSTRFDDNFKPEEVAAVSMFRAEIEDEHVDVELENVVGRPAAYAVLAALAVGKHFELGLSDMVQSLKYFTPMAGRLRVIAGIKGSILIDDSYNAAPASTVAALDILEDFSPAEGSRRIAALGDMLELGSLSEEEHRQVGKRAVDLKVDLLVTAGERARDIARGAIEAGMSEDQIQSFKNSEEAGRWLDANLEKGDIILIKGSQGARMEKITKDLMAEPHLAQDLLVRQYPPWIELN